MPIKTSKRRRTINSLCAYLESQGILDPSRACGDVTQGLGKSYTEKELEKLIVTDIVSTQTSILESKDTEMEENTELGEREFKELFLDTQPKGESIFQSLISSPVFIEKATSTLPTLSEPPPEAISTEIQPPPSTGKMEMPPGSAKAPPPPGSAKAPPAPPPPGSVKAPPPPPPPGSVKAPPAPPPPGSVKAPPPPPPPGSAKAPPAPPPPGSAKAPPPPSTPAPTQPQKESLFGEMASKTLKKTEPPQPKPAPKPEGTAGLIAAIFEEGGPKLKKIPPPEEKPVKLEPKDQTASKLSKTIDERRKSLEPQRKTPTGPRLYKIQDIAKGCAKITDEKTCENAEPICNYDEFGDPPGCVEDEDAIDDYPPEWWWDADKFSDKFDLNDFKKYLAERKTYLLEHEVEWKGGYEQSGSWLFDIMTKLNQFAVPFGLKDQELAQVAIWKIWIKKAGVLDSQLYLITKALFSYDQTQWNYDLFYKFVLNGSAKIDNSFDWKSCYEYWDCSAQSLYRAFSSAIYHDKKQSSRITPERQAKFMQTLEGKVEETELEIDKLQKLLSKKLTFENEIASLKLKLDNARASNDSQQQTTLEALINQFQDNLDYINNQIKTENGEEASESNILKTDDTAKAISGEQTKIEESSSGSKATTGDENLAKTAKLTLLETERASKQAEINTLEDTLGKIKTPRGASIADQAATTTKQRELRQQISLEKANLQRLDDQIAAFGSTSSPINPLQKERDETVKQLELLKTELSKFPPRGGNVMRKSQLKNKLIPELEAKLLELDRKLNQL